MVLVTGGSGFVGSHTILQLLAAGHQVRATVREPRARGRRARHARRRAAPTAAASACRSSPPISNPTPAGRRRSPGATTCCTSRRRFPATIPKDENELIVPAREGALRVLRAARDAGVKRVVLTSSFAAIGYGHPLQSQPFDENSWTDPAGGDVAPYVKSKTLAERAAWEFIEQEGGALELAVGQSGRCLRPGARARLLDVDPAGEAPDGRRGARLPEALLRRGRRARRRRSAPARHDRSRGQGRAFPGGGGRLPVHAGDRARS